MIHIATKKYSVSASSYIRFMMLAFFRKWWYVFIIPMLFVLSLSTYDYRYIILFFIVVLILLPSLLMYMSFYYALDTECVVAIREKQAIFSNTSITFHFTQTETKTFDDIEYKFDLFTHIRKDSQNFYFYLSNYKFLVVPLSSFISTEDITLISSLIFKK